MHCSWRAVVCALISWGALAQVHIAAQTSHPPGSDNPQVQVFLSVRSQATPLALSPSDLSVSVDKRPAQVNEVRPANGDPLLFAILADTSKSEQRNAAFIKSAILELFQALSNGDNQGYLVFFNDLVASSKMPLSLTQVQQALDLVRFSGGTAIYDAIDQTCTHQLGASQIAKTPRRAIIIIIISDGEDNSSRESHEKVETLAQTQGIAIFSFVTPASALSGARGERFLKEISQQTGGRAIAAKNLATDLPPLVTAINGQWVVSFAPSQAGNQKLQSLQVKIKQKGVDIAAPAHVVIP